MSIVIRVENLSKRYRLGLIGTTVSHKRAHNQGRVMDTAAHVYGLHCAIVADKVLGRLLANGSLTAFRKQAIADLYWLASRPLWKESKSDYRRVVRKIHNLHPKFVPKCPTYAGPKMRNAVKWLGPRGAERLMELVSIVLGMIPGLPFRQ